MVPDLSLRSALSVNVPEARRREGRLRFAGEHFAENFGYTHGAVDSGYDAAHEVIAEYRRAALLQFACAVAVGTAALVWASMLYRRRALSLIKPSSSSTAVQLCTPVP